MKNNWDGQALLAEVIRSGGTGRDYAMRIDVHGQWFYQNSLIRRRPLVKLFASVLRRAENGTYWLVTPAEQGMIEVEDVPFTCVELEAVGEGQDCQLRFRTNLDDWITADSKHRILMREGPAAEGLMPYVEKGDGLQARVLRPVYYELADFAEPGPDGKFGVWSAGVFFPLERSETGSF